MCVCVCVCVCVRARARACVCVFDGWLIDMSVCAAKTNKQTKQNKQTKPPGISLSQSLCMRVFV